MNKETFLKELSERLHVLNEKERQDVLEEYAQHIDLKIENGQSEEEAVRDFGTPEELCEELLDAYHINAEYAAGPVQSQNGAVQSQTGTESKSGGRIGAVLKRMQKGDNPNSGEKKKLSDKIPGFQGKKTEENVPVKSAEELLAEQEEKRRLEEERQMHLQEKKQQKAEQIQEKRQKRAEHLEVKKAKREEWLQEKKQKHKEHLVIKEQKRMERKEQMAVLREERRKKRQEQEVLRIRRGGSWFGRALGKTCSFIGFLCVLFWKGCLFIVAAPFLIMALMALFCTGVVAVWLWQGYPLLGITLLGAGGFLASAGVTGLLLSYVFTGKRAKTSVGKGEETIYCEKGEPK